MKITKLDERFAAKRLWGYQYSVTFPYYQWKKYYAFKRKTEEMLGLSLNLDNKFYFRDHVRDSLKFKTWAYKYVKLSKDTTVYFRTEEDMNKVGLMYALTATE